MRHIIGTLGTSQYHDLFFISHSQCVTSSMVFMQADTPCDVVAPGENAVVVVFMIFNWPNLWVLAIKDINSSENVGCAAHTTHMRAICYGPV